MPMGTPQAQCRVIKIQPQEGVVTKNTIVNMLPNPLEFTQVRLIQAKQDDIVETYKDEKFIYKEIICKNENGEEIPDLSNYMAIKKGRFK